MDDAVAARSEFTLRLRHRFEAPREKVFAAWTNPEALKRWWCPPGWHPLEIAVDLQEGGRYTFSMQRESGAQVITAHGTFLTIKVPSQLIYSWIWDGVFPDMPVTTVTVDFRNVNGGTELELRQEDLSLRVCGQHLTGWMDALERLSAEVLTTTGEWEYVSSTYPFLSTIPVVAAAAAFDLVEIGGEYIADYATREFPAEAWPVANHPTHSHGNVVPFPRYVRPANAKQRDLPPGPSLLPTADRLREIAALSCDSMVTEGPVHPDHRLLDLCAEALHLFSQADEAGAIHIPA
jgi:uncharacterized protein YndB with AHSA1/START domain